MTTLYSKQGNKLRTWKCYAEGKEVVVIHGQVGGKQVEKRYTAEPTNIGRSNERDSLAQAAFEVQAKIDLQLKRGYYRTQEEALGHVDFTPMKAQNSNDHKHKIVYPCYVERKLNGQRCMVDKDGVAWSKQGEPLQFPTHWIGLSEIAKRFQGLDGEVFAGSVKEGGMPLQDIISAFRKPNQNTPKLKYYVYDIPVEGMDMMQRVKKLSELQDYVEREGINYIVVVLPEVVNSWDEVEERTKAYVAEGQEGAIVRNMKGLYEFGKRSYDLLKVKFREDAEAEVLSYTLDKNDEPVYTVRAVNGDQVGVQFKLKMKIPDGVTVLGRNYRDKANANHLIGKHITYQYEELSSDNIPTKPVGLYIREVDQNGNPLI